MRNSLLSKRVFFCTGVLSPHLRGLWPRVWQRRRRAPHAVRVREDCAAVRIPAGQPRESARARAAAAGQCETRGARFVGSGVCRKEGESQDSSLFLSLCLQTSYHLSPPTYPLFPLSSIAPPQALIAVHLRSFGNYGQWCAHIGVAPALARPLCAAISSNHLVSGTYCAGQMPEKYMYFLILVPNVVRLGCGGK